MKGKVRLILLAFAVTLATISIVQTELVMYASEIEHQSSLHIANIANNFNLISLCMVLIMVSVIAIAGYFARKYKKENKHSSN
ncbi:MULTISPECIES: hypothetical protein [unclassified Breznakia]|uniref:hypothetical protein n=1 Tax=unclassified Breznakia TaxID=2623764 RepID=UPI002475CC52|nr:MULTISPECIES: hypothetical protein [unclassified Breznakia]MDH6367087.1 heme/copper-type cytochrome/quinol oxidase subunit 2 [Breznakia sp. PH1-1]MDH6404326.1 heme/copper-type cytochrome/quinol oxidase subunit 2 [Breznakia sp. PF1-11]MDH6411974.1 heme/copper-type cytochrome/quinol oxidase subunit 2 [Breznakia sp. PFB1-11]MDH6414314.1 heme/copper-type cytochrome/quinol oxidase subunit 2 [Breznakia sp. PFB1-14]MDH6416588.1 heme/copper-type cytochrome/quinol oxidase subunit 2 [Breznakia sp. PF